MLNNKEEMKLKAKQHQLGQHYSKETLLVERYNNYLLEIKNKTIVDPFCGEGHLLEHYLNLFDKNIQIEMLKNKKIMGFDIDENNIIFLRKKFKKIYNLDDNLLEEIFIVNDSLIFVDKIPNNSFIFTNPPYLAKNICKKKFPEDFDKYFNEKYKILTDYFEISLELYGKYDGLWIVPSNVLSSDIMNKLRKKILLKMDKIVVYKKKTFDDTDISVATFLIDNKLSNNIKDIIFVSNKEEIKKFEISKNSNLVKEWDDIKSIKNSLNIKQGFLDSKIVEGDKNITLLNTNYKEEEFNISNEQYEKLNKNILILRTTDTGGKEGKIGLYTIKELWGSDKAIGLITKISSRVYTQLFFDNLSIKEQLKLKDDFNNKLNKLRLNYDSIFLTNYKNVSNENQRKRMSFKETFSLINYIIKK